VEGFLAAILDVDADADVAMIEVQYDNDNEIYNNQPCRLRGRDE
jgi:hypothetical protein